MEKPVIGKRAYRKWVFLVLAVLLPTAVFIIRQCKMQEIEYSIIQAVIKELPNYQDDF